MTSKGWIRSIIAGRGIRPHRCDRRANPISLPVIGKTIQVTKQNMGQIWLQFNGGIYIYQCQEMPSQITSRNHGECKLDSPSTPPASAGLVQGHEHRDQYMGTPSIYRHQCTGFFLWCWWAIASWRDNLSQRSRRSSGLACISIIMTPWRFLVSKMLNPFI